MSTGGWEVLDVSPCKSKPGSRMAPAPAKVRRDRGSHRRDARRNPRGVGTRRRPRL